MAIDRIDTEAGPSTTSQARQPPQGRKRKAGGEGKKGKIFLEDKAGLLSLINDVTDSKASIVESRLAKSRAKDIALNKPSTPATSANKQAQGGDGTPGSRPSSGVKKEKKEPKPSEKRRRDKDRALREAKEALIAKEKEKKRRKKAGGDKQPAEAVTTKKRVGFA